MVPEDTNDKTVEEINKEYNDLQTKQNQSNIQPGLNIGHELPQEKEERERKEKEAKAKALVDSMQGELKQYIDSQMQAIPNLINQNIQAAFQQIAPQLQQQVAPQGDNSQDKIAAIAQLAPVLQGLLGQGQAAAPQSNIFQDMIMQSFVKMIQAKVDETVMGTYGVRVPPPQDIIAPAQPQQSRVDIE